jgi:hypothetical protein
MVSIPRHRAHQIRPRCFTRRDDLLNTRLWSVDHRSHHFLFLSELGTRSINILFSPYAITYMMAMPMSKEVKEQDLTLSPVISKADGIVHHVNIGYTAQLQKRRSLLSIMGMTLAIAAVPYGIGGTLMSAVR